MLGARNTIGLTERQIQSCLSAWQFLCGKNPRPLDVSEASRHWSRTRYDEERGIVILGADVYRGTGATANARMSILACLAHELAHALRKELGFNRPIIPPDSFLDEAETSIFAAFESILTDVDRFDLVEDARDRVFDWLAAKAA
jgi:hypothetical protein